MKKRNIITFILILAISLIIGACSGGGALKDDLPPYTDFIEGEGRINFEVDENVTIDGKLDEEIWANCQNSIYWQSGDTKYLMPDGSRKDKSVLEFLTVGNILTAFFRQTVKGDGQSLIILVYISVMDIRQLLHTHNIHLVIVLPNPTDTFLYYSNISNHQ